MVNSPPQIVKVIIASPGDLIKERECIPNLFVRWNSAKEDVFLQPLMCELSSVPSLGDHPQHILNEQMIAKGDLLVALFWSRIGTPTPSAKSGTLEEIREFIEKKGAKRVMVYFCNRLIDMNKVDPDELAKLNEFKEEMRTKGLYCEFKDTNEFEKYLYQHLDMKVNQLRKGELSVPEDEMSVLSENAWYNPKHPDSRLQKPHDFGYSLPEIAQSFSERMNEFDRESAGENKYLDLGVHIYKSVAKSIDYVLIIKSHEIPNLFSSKFRKIISKLDNLVDSRDIENFSAFWEEGRNISNEMNKLVDKIKE